MLTTRKGAILPFRQDEVVHGDNNNGSTTTNTNHYRYQRRGTRQSASKWTSITSGRMSTFTSHSSYNL